MKDKIESKKILTRSTIDGNRILCKFYKKILSNLLFQGIIKIRPKEVVVREIYIRMFFYLSSLTRLDRMSDYQAMMACIRPMCEHYIDLVCLANDKQGEWLEKYVFYADAARYITAIKISRYEENLNGQEYEYFMNDNFVQSAKLFVKDNEKRIRQEALRLWNIDPIDQKKQKEKTTEKLIPSSWRNMDMRNFSKINGMEDLYMKVHPIYNWFAHSGRPGFYNIDDGTVDSLFFYSHTLAFNMFLDATKIIAEMFEITKAIKNFYDVFFLIKEAPNDIARAEYISQLRSTNPEIFEEDMQSS